MLIRKAQQRNEAAFSELRRRTFNCAIKLATHILRDRNEAEDEVQNSYMKAWQYIGQFQGQSKFSTWIFRIVTNQCLMRLRQLRGRASICLNSAPDDGQDFRTEIPDRCLNPEDEYSFRQRSQLLREEISKLPPLLRQVLLLRDIGEMSTSEVAARLGISEFAVKSRLIRARSEVSNRWAKHEQIPVRTFSEGADDSLSALNLGGTYLLAAL